MVKVADEWKVWAHGFATGVAVCTIGAYVRYRYVNHRPRLIHDDATVIPID